MVDTHPLPTHGGPPSSSPVTDLDFGVHAGLQLPFHGGSSKMFIESYGLHYHTKVMCRPVFTNAELHPMLPAEHHRWPYQEPRWKLDQAMTIGFNFLGQRVPSHSISRSLLFNLFLEDSHQLAEERKNYHHGNAMHIMSMPHCCGDEYPIMSEFALHPTGPILNALNLSKIDLSTTTNAESASDGSRSADQSPFDCKSSVQLSSTIMDVSKPTRMHNGGYRMVVASTSSQFVHLIRIGSDRHQSPEVVDLHRINLGSQPFPSITNPSILHECSFLSHEGRFMVYDAAAAAEIFSCNLDPLNSIWLRQAYCAHPRIVQIASRMSVRRLDLRTNLFMYNVPGSLVYDHRTDSPITAFQRHPTDAFSFALATWSHVALFDERYTSRPVLSWQHHRVATKTRPQQIEFFSFDDRLPDEGARTLLATFSTDHAAPDIYRYSKIMDETQQNDGAVIPQSVCQQLDVIDEAQLWGIAFSACLQGPRNSFRLYRLTGIGTVIYSEYELIDGTIDYGEPCPQTAKEDPVYFHSHMSLLPFKYLDVSKGIEQFEALDRPDDDDSVLDEAGIIEFLDLFRPQILAFTTEWRPLSEFYHFARDELNMAPAARSLDFYSAVQRIIESLPLLFRTIPGINRAEEAISTTSIDPPSIAIDICQCSTSSMRDCIPAANCVSASTCQALLRSAVATRDQIASFDFESIWDNDRIQLEASAPLAAVDLSNDMDALMELLDADDEDAESKRPDADPTSSRDEHGGSAAIDLLESLKQSWGHLIQSDSYREDE